MQYFEESVERYDLVNGKENIEDIISKHFPEYESKAKEIRDDIIYKNIEDLPTSAILTPRSKNRIEMDLHVTNEKGSNKICGKFGLKKGKDSLLVFKNDFDNVWELVGKVRSF